MASLFNLNTSPLLLLLLLLLSSGAGAESQPECSKSGGGCRNKAVAMKFRLIAVASILATSMIGVCLPLFSRAVPALRPDKDVFTVVKAFGSGVILATGYMHVLPDSIASLSSDCLPESPWRRFPFSTFVAMLSAIATLMVDSFSMSYYRKHFLLRVGDGDGERVRNGAHQILGHVGHENGKMEEGVSDKGSELLRRRVVAQVLELGIVVHSVVIGLSMGASDNPCTIRPLIAAICFHQLFEGMGLGGCILQAEYGVKMRAIMVFFFSFTTPLGIALGICLSNIYSENSPTALIVVGLLDACSAGLLNYMALVDLLAADFMGPKLQAGVKLQIWAYFAVLLGAGAMSVMAMWA
ncbi:Zinc/iron permease [Parasponia andersonii]|uniref:Zinc/iron permease n=1 Tax=Parasponia andersonii TaxID=3476 RepID=A0A2P5DMW5_PARAD|nr:Zinc/iron permease [Parasponia andersonii]